MNEKETDKPLRAAPQLPDNTVSKQAGEELVELCAAITHEVNRAYCATMNEHHLPWTKAPQWQVDSAIAGVQAILENPKLTPADQHALWCERKFSESWHLGAVKDEKAKTHPCLMPYEMLSPYQRAKDVLFGAVVRTFFGL